MEAVVGPAALAIECGVAARPRPGETICGDVHVLKPFRGGVLVAALDGLGHGSGAASAAGTASAILEAHADEPVIALMMRCHEGLRATRGVVMSIASFDVAHGLMTWLGVGNALAIVLRRGSAPDAPEEPLLLRGGVVGCQPLPALRAEVLCIAPGDTLVLATDGIGSDFSRQLARSLPPKKAADAILARHGRPTDDALVLVARYLGALPPK
jgi:phosphoserine phosphatase RsbX